MSNHSFDIHIATEYKSIEIATLVWHFQYWIMKNKRLGRNFIEGRTWTYQTNLEIAAAFPYWSIYQVERLIKKAIELKILRKHNYNKSQFDRTVWYAFENEEKFGISRFREMESAESGNGIREIAESDNKDTDTLPDALTNKNIAAEEPQPSSPLPRKKIKDTIREVHAGVWLTTTQEGSFLEKCNLDQSLANKCYIKYSDWKISKSIIGGKNDYKALIDWVLDAVKKDNPTFQSPGPTSSEDRSEIAKKNKKLCEMAESKLSHLFNSYVFFQAGPTMALLHHAHKNLKKEYIYDSFDPKQLKELLLQDLGNSFPRAHEILLGSKHSNISDLINNLTEKMKLTEATR